MGERLGSQRSTNARLGENSRSSARTASAGGSTDKPPIIPAVASAATRCDGPAVAPHARARVAIVESPFTSRDAVMLGPEAPDGREVIAEPCTALFVIAALASVPGVRAAPAPHATWDGPLTAVAMASRGDPAPANLSNEKRARILVSAA